jgi:hypothetical protein
MPRYPHYMSKLEWLCLLLTFPVAALLIWSKK